MKHWSKMLLAARILPMVQIYSREEK